MTPLDRFYTALKDRDWVMIATLYHDQARFSDPIFPDLDAEHVRAMWKMLLSGGTDLKIEHAVLEENGSMVRTRLEARYTFSRTGRVVHNRISSEFRFKEGRIIQQRDQFDLWRWSRQALGPAGLLLGWTPYLQNRIRRQAGRALAKAM